MPSTTIISTLRHACTDYNAQRRYAGSIDIPLSDAGRQEAQRAALKLAQTSFDLVVSSPLKRAYQTAQIIAGNELPIITNSLCSERNFGALEGLTWDEVRNIQPAILLIQVGNDLHTVNPRGAEPFEDVWQRAKEFRSWLLAQYRGSSVLVVSHGVFLQMFNGLVRGLSCIESLAHYPGNLELARFWFEEELLVEQTLLRLGGGEIASW